VLICKGSGGCIARLRDPSSASGDNQWLVDGQAAAPAAAASSRQPLRRHRRMPTRRDLLRLAAVGGAGAALPACGESRYERVIAETWRHAAATPAEPVALLRELVRYATLAANSHNTQPWRFAIGADTIVIQPDLSRRTPAVDPDDHHLWVSLGCAAENLALAAAAFGRRAEVEFEPRMQLIRIFLESMPPVRSPLFGAIARRQCTRAEYDGRPLAATELRALESTAGGPAVQVLLLTGRQRIDDAIDFVTQGNSAQMRDAAFVSELKQWIRFDEGAALSTGDGLFARSSGNPAVPGWLGRLLFRYFFTEQAENDRYARQMRSSAGVIVFVGRSARPAQWLEVGRAYQRFALLAASLGIRNAFVNQPVEVPALREQFAGWLGIGGQRPDLVVRFGRGPLLPPSLRRPIDAVIGGPRALQAGDGAAARRAPA
jgi:hypothetical protein